MIGRPLSRVGRDLPCPAQRLDRDSMSSNPLTSPMYLTCCNFHSGHNLDSDDLLRVLVN
jgi:hypothetical protein